MLKSLFRRIKKKQINSEINNEIKKFDIFETEKHCPICESELINVHEKHWDYYEGTYMRYRLHCKNNCYVRILDTDRPPHAQQYVWKIFGKTFYVFNDERKDRQIKALYTAIDYWKTGERYLVETLLEGKCEWKN